ncbi:MAG: GDP-mannose 4,6-dehydratase [Lachnospiraceae bacterium]|nr:GDP-mannose 4,6-dehydratase [Lachnospiraceae bacterium]
MKRISLFGKCILVTGAGGFIGSNLVLKLLKSDEHKNMLIIGVDNMNEYYDVALKEYRIGQIEKAAKDSSSKWVFYRNSIADEGFIKDIFSRYDIKVVVNLAAQAGVRYSIENPDAYMEANVMGFYRILEACRHSLKEKDGGVEHLVYASSSSIYGDSKDIPYRVDAPAEHPVSLYAATKKSDELLAHAYSKLYEIPSTALRFFTVYGPAGRPDMAYFGFTDILRKGGKIKIFNHGDLKRDFTYVDDVVEGVIRVMQGAPDKKKGEDGLPLAPYAIYNIGNSKPVDLMEFIGILAAELKEAGVLAKDFDLQEHQELLPMQPGDVAVTFADTSALERDFGYRPSTDLKSGLRAFATWYKEFYLS